VIWFFTRRSLDPSAEEFGGAIVVLIIMCIGAVAIDNYVKGRPIDMRMFADFLPTKQSKAVPERMATLAQQLIAPTKEQTSVVPERTTDAKPADSKEVKLDGADEKWLYYLQVGAFRNQTDAESARTRLALLGFEARISEHTSDIGSLYRVRIGSFSDLETLNKMRSKLSDSGISFAVVRSTK
jgi:cell division protein FtsN